MVRPIQRGKKKAKPKQTTDKTITNHGTNQNVQQITIKLEHPTPIKPKRRAPAKKKDTKKEEAVEELKEELEDYNKYQTEAGEIGLELPAELGVSPSDASALKSSDDIFTFIQIIREKKAKIIEMINEKRTPPQQLEPAPSQNRFFTPQPMLARASLPAPPIMPSVPDIEPNRQIQRGLSDSEIERQLKQLERQGAVSDSVAVRAFALKDRKTASILANIQGNIDTARASGGNGVLTPSQIDRFIAQLDAASKRYKTDFSLLPEADRLRMKTQETELLDKIEVQKANLLQERDSGNVVSQKALPPPEPPSFEKELNDTLINVNRIISHIKSSPKSAFTEQDFIMLNNELNAIQNKIQERYDSIDKINSNRFSAEYKIVIERINEARKLGSSPKSVWKPLLPPPPAPIEIDAEKEANRQKAIRNLTLYVNSDPSAPTGFKLWSPQIQKALLSHAGVSQEEIDRIGLLPAGDRRKEAVGKAMGIKKRTKIVIVENPPQPAVKKEDTSTDTPPPQELTPPPPALPVCKSGETGGQRRMCIQPTTAPPQVKAGDGKRLMQTTSYGEYIQLQRQYAGSSNVIVQPPRPTIM
jgi:hypothetical protein